MASCMTPMIVLEGVLVVFMDIGQNLINKILIYLFYDDSKQY